MTLRKESMNQPISPFIWYPLVFEEWRSITSNSVPNVIPNTYFVSNFGEVYSKFSNRKLTLVESANGYFRVGIMKLSGETRYQLIHRIVMIEFTGEHELNVHWKQINHKDGNKANNFIGNLEWVTPSQNIQHAFDTGLKTAVKGEDCPRSTITNEQAEQVGYYLSLGKYSHKQISEITGIPLHIIDNVSRGSTWRSVYDKYNLKEHQRKRNDYSFSDRDLHKICKYFEQHPASNYKYITDLFRETLSELFDIEYCKGVQSSMSRIYNKKTRRDITERYNY